MKKQTLLLLFLFVLACLSGYLMSQPSLVGKVGIDLFYKQYKFLQTWWQGALLVFIVWLVLLFGQGLAQNKLQGRQALWLQLTMIVAALAGFYLTWSDFHHSTTHRWLKTRFHLGAYLFWLGWILISISYLLPTKPVVVNEIETVPS